MQRYAPEMPCYGKLIPSLAIFDTWNFGKFRSVDYIPCNRRSDLVELGQRPVVPEKLLEYIHKELQNVFVSFANDYQLISKIHQDEIKREIRSPCFKPLFPSNFPWIFPLKSQRKPASSYKNLHPVIEPHKEFQSQQ